MPDDNLLRQFVHRRNQVVRETRRQELPLVVVVVALVKRGPDALGDAAADGARDLMLADA